MSEIMSYVGEWPAYVAAMIFLGVNLPTSKAVQALNINASVLNNAPIDAKTFDHMLKSAKKEHSVFYSYVQDGDEKNQWNKGLQFLKQGGLIYMDPLWLCEQRFGTCTDARIREAFDSILHAAEHGNHNLDLEES